MSKVYDTKATHYSILFKRPAFFKHFAIGLIATSAVLLSGCASAPYEPQPPTNNLQQNIQQQSYRLDAGDKVNIRVFEEKSLTGEYEVDSNGAISFPLVGSIDVKNKTVAETENLIETGLADGYIVDPKVSVEVLTYRPFYILGEVKQPGAYTYVNDISASKAVALAGGYTYRANKNYALIKRANNQDKEYKITPGTSIYPGDIITIKERYF